MYGKKRSSLIRREDFLRHEEQLSQSGALLMKKNSFLENCIFLHIKKKIFGDVKNSETSLGLLIECK